jgi:RNA polymerase sigma-70 factor (ECF subfamily)
MSVEPSDGQLITDLQSGDLGALGILYERHKTKVYRTALAITRDPTTAEDVLQDCFLRMYEYSHSIDGSLPLQPWLYRVTANLAFNLSRRRKRWQAALDEMIYWLTGPILRSPEWQAEKSDAREKMMHAISLLSINQRIVIVLYYLNSLSVKEIASILDCPVGTVKSRLYHGRENLRRRLEARYEMTLEVVYEPV